MKLRVKGNSLRLRVTRSELDALVRTGRIEDTTRLGVGADCRLIYALELSEIHDRVSLRCAWPEIAVVLPSAQAATWRDSDQVGIYSTTDLGQHRSLELAIEKDFACLDRREEDNLDTFPNPLAGAAC